MDIITVSPTKTATSLVIPVSAWPLAADTNKIIIRIAEQIYVLIPRNQEV